MTIIYLTLAWLAGIWLAAGMQTRFSDHNPHFWLLGAGGALVVSWLFRRQPRQLLLLVALIFLFLGGLRYMLTIPQHNKDHIPYYNGSGEVIITGLVITEPELRDRSIQLRLRAETVTTAAGETILVDGLVQVVAPRFPMVDYGQKLRLNGRLETPAADGDFDYRAYLARQGVHSVMVWPRLTVLAEKQGSSFYQGLYAFKKRAHETILALLPEPQASLLTGILLGNDAGMPPGLAEEFRLTGMTHIIAISGFNISLLVGIFLAVGQPFFGPRRAAWFALVGVAGYTLLVGAEAAVVRAAIMGGLHVIASRLLGRPTFAPASLFTAALIMTMLNPQTLWDVGFQLSFAATLGLMLYADPLTQWTRRRLLLIFDRRWTERLLGLISEALLVTLAAQILTLPLMIAYFGQLSLISLAANLFILPVQPAVMAWGGLAVLAGLVHPLLGQPLAWVAWLFLSYTIELVRIFAGAPLAAVPLSLSPGGLIWLLALILGLTWLGRQKRAMRARLRAFISQNIGQRLLISGSAVAAMLALAWAVSQPDGRLHIAFLDVGQGDAIFIQTPHGRQILVDGGLYPTVLNGQLGQQMPFWDRHIDLLVATHPDADHVAGLPGVFDRYQVGRLITDGETDGSDTYQALLAAADGQQTAVVAAQAGQVLLVDGVRLEVVNPVGALDPRNRNENSVAFRLLYGDFSLLLTGDAESLAEQAMLQSGRPLRALVFKAGHHGSNTSSSTAFLTAVQPQVIVVSAGKDNRFGHPHPDMLQRAYASGAVVLRTDELGAIEIVTDGRRMWWQARR